MPVSCGVSCGVFGGLPTLPLLDRGAGEVVFWRGTGEGVTARGFVADAWALAGRLPPGRYVANLCRDRYAFAVGFAAGLLAGRTALLNVDAAGLEGVLGAYPGCCAVVDAEVPGLAVPSVVVELGGELSGGGVRWDGVGAEIAADHVAAVVFTSGSTGVPVGHPKLWGAMVACTRAAATRFGFGAGTVVVGTVPGHHMYGFETTVLMPLHAGVASWCGSAFFPGDIACAVRAGMGRAVLVTTPLQVRMLLAAGLAAGTVLEGVEMVISATAPLTGALAAAAEAAWDAPVLEIFGATECGSIASRRTVEGEAWLPYPGTVVRIGEAGAMVEAPGAGVVALADVLEESGGGGFRLLGRRTDVVKLGGRRTSLPRLNQVLTELPGVDDGVFVVPDEGEDGAAARLVAVVVAPGRSVEAILAALRGRIDPAFMPRRVIRVDAMPRNAVGKLPRQALLRLVAGASGVEAGAD